MLFDCNSSLKNGTLKREFFVVYLSIYLLLVTGVSAPVTIRRMAWLGNEDNFKTIKMVSI